MSVPAYVGRASNGTFHAYTLNPNGFYFKFYATFYRFDGTPTGGAVCDSFVPPVWSFTWDNPTSGGDYPWSPRVDKYRTGGEYYNSPWSGTPPYGHINYETLYTRTISALTGGSVKRTGGDYNTTTITGTPTPTGNKRFKEWRYANGTVVTSKTNLIVQTVITINTGLKEDVDVYAYFIDATVPLSVNANSGGTISTWVDGVSKPNVTTLDTTKTYSIRVLATPTPLTHNFVGWYSAANGGGTLISASADYTFSYDASNAGSGVTLYGFFKEKADIAVTTVILLDGTPETEDTDGNSFALVTAEPLKAGVVKFALVYNSSHYWAKPVITISEKLIGSSSDYNVVTLQPDDYAVDIDGNVSLNLAPLQAWVAEQDPINFAISADFAAIPVGATVIQGVNAGTYSWMYSVQFSNWSGRGYTSPEEEPNRPMTPLYGDTGTVTITPFNTARMKLGRIAVRYGNTTVIDEATTSSTENSYVFTANVTGPMTITVTLKAKIELAYLTTPLPEEITFTVNGTTLTAGQYVYAVVGAPSSVDYSGTPLTTVFEDWYIEEYAPYLVNGAMLVVSSHIAVHPYTFIPNAYMTIYPSFVVADENPYVAIQFYNASSQSVFIPGGSNPTLLQTQDSSNVGGTGQSGSNAGLSPNWSTSTRDAMRVYVRGLSAEDSVFNTAFAEDGSTLFVRLPSLGVLTMEAVGTPSLPFLRFEKASITKGVLNPPSDCILGAWSAIDPIVNPASFNIIVACAYRVVFGTYQPQKNIAAYKSSAMRSMGSITVTGYSSSTASDGSVTATTGYGDSVTWVATPFIGYKFTGWYSLSGETYTLVSTDAEYSLEQDSIRRTLYAEFAQDTTKLYLMEGGEQNKTAYWKSKRFELQRPLSFSACRIDAEGYPVQLKTHTFSSPSVSDASDTGVVICEDQDARRIQTMRKERFCEFSVETLHPVVGMSFSTTMQGLS